MSAPAIQLDEAYSAESFFARAAPILLGEPPDPASAISIHQVANPSAKPFPVQTYRDAAVLVPIVDRKSGAKMLLTVRHDGLSAHAGQVAFPGGKIDPDDAGPAAAALREAEEEIGLTADKIETRGYMNAYLTGTGFRVVPVLARVAPDHELTLNPDEVSAAFEVPLEFLMQPDNHALKTRMRQGRLHYFYEMPFEGFYIWGITAGIIRGLYEQVYR